MALALFGLWPSVSQADEMKKAANWDRASHLLSDPSWLGLCRSLSLNKARVGGLSRWGAAGEND